MKKQFKEAEIEITKFSIADSIATNFVSDNNDWGEISLEEDFEIEY